MKSFKEFLSESLGVIQKQTYAAYHPSNSGTTTKHFNDIDSALKHTADKPEYRIQVYNHYKNGRMAPSGKPLDHKGKRIQE